MRTPQCKPVRGNKAASQLAACKDIEIPARQEPSDPAFARENNLQLHAVPKVHANLFRIDIFIPVVRAQK
jgi:hypothetical protein